MASLLKRKVYQKSEKDSVLPYSFLTHEDIESLIRMIESGDYDNINLVWGILQDRDFPKEPYIYELGSWWWSTFYDNNNCIRSKFMNKYWSEVYNLRAEVWT